MTSEFRNDLRAEVRQTSALSTIGPRRVEADEKSALFHDLRHFERFSLRNSIVPAAGLSGQKEAGLPGLPRGYASFWLSNPEARGGLPACTGGRVLSQLRAEVKIT